jgi:hypothetical protein
MTCSGAFDECPLGSLNPTVSFMDAALHYVALGYAVFPLSPRSSIPHHRLPRMEYGRGGVHHASTDGDRVRQWWTDWPDANIGLATGTASGVIALDVDVPIAVEEHLPEIKEVVDMADDHVWQSTPSGGRHIILRYTDAMGNHVPLVPGLDVKADGGYVVASPSWRVEPESKAHLYYRWNRCPQQPADISSELIEFINKPRDRIQMSNSYSASMPRPMGSSIESEFLENGFSVGSRNIDAHRLACRLWRRVMMGHLTRKELFSKMEKAWDNTSDRESFPWRECGKAIESARRYIESDYQFMIAWHQPFEGNEGGSHGS